MAQSACGADSETLYTISRIALHPQPIFDENAPNTIALHRWANALHIVTKPFVLAERLPFDEHDEVTQQDIVEAEAILRNERYIANAEIEANYDCAQQTVGLDVTSYDNWSLIPTLSFSRSGGENSTLLGIREDNLLGLGIRSTFRYTDDEQRTGYQLGFVSAVPGVRHSNIYIDLADNDDGEIYGLVFAKPFYFLNSRNSYQVSLQSTALTEDIYHNGQTRNSLDIDAHEVSLSYGWQLAGSALSTSRITVGMTKLHTRFLLAPESPAQNPLFVPEDRDFFYPSLAYEFIQRDIVVLQNIYLIEQPEDINLGWELTARLGVELDNSHSSVGMHSTFAARKGVLTDDALFLFSGAFHSITNTQLADFLRLDIKAEHFYRISPRYATYASLTATVSDNNFADRPIVIDDDNGVRGFPNQYQHGRHRITASAELRLFTGYNFYQLFDVGLAGFVDAGRAFDGPFAAFNEDPGWLSSVGLGARLYSNKSSNPGIAHIDFARPFGDGGNINNWEWSLQFRRAF